MLILTKLSATKLLALVLRVGQDVPVHLVRVEVSEDGDRSGDADAGLANVMLEEVRTQELLVRGHPDGDDFIDQLSRSRVFLSKRANGSIKNIE